MVKKSRPPGDDYIIRCPRLGHQIHFSYCCSENKGMPCSKTLDCWFEHFPVEDYIREILTPEEWEKIFDRPARSKVQTLMGLIEQAKKVKKENE